MSESQGSQGSSVSEGAAHAEPETDGLRTDGSSGMDERSQRLLQGGAGSRSWSDQTGRDPGRTDHEGSGHPAATATQHTAPSGATAGGGQSAGGGRAVQNRRARLRVSHINPMSVLRLSLVFGACMIVVLLVAVAALWFVLNSAGVFSSISDATSTFTDSAQGGGIGKWFGFGRVMLITMVLGVVNLLAFTLLSTVGALLYNLCADFVGGVEVTLSER